ncbi:hypothetical protein RclHR1_02260017 [Rhizophagus clarus]|uniref:Uncharacterized protein n=1 Tax=Rhizophagus clarus TaxID=94130 RepID=A0A2Z6QZC6_9GLOM|nr:hypothetical protein RclHR1_02260017 [Rhizophagus clarus]
MKRRSFLNLMFLIAFLIEIILSIVGISIISIFEIPIRTADFVILFFVIFLSGIYTILVKKLVYFLVFCIVHTIPITVLADDLSFFRPQDDEILKTTYVAIFTITLFVIFFMTLFIIIWRKKYWGVNSRTKISIPKNLKSNFKNNKKGIKVSYAFYLSGLLTFDPILDKEYEYSNDFSLDINIDEEEKDEKASETLKRYLKAIKTFFYNGVVRQILDLIK